MPQFIFFVLHREPLVQIRGPDAARLAAHRYNRRKALARQKITPDACHQDGNGNQPREQRSSFLHHLFLWMQGLQNDQRVRTSLG